MSAPTGNHSHGWLLASGNPKGVLGVADLGRVALVNREPGAGARRLLDDELGAAGIDPAEVAGYETVVHGHAAVARAVASGAADAGVSTAAIAAAYGLGFVPLQTVRYDLALRKSSLFEEPVQLLLDALGTRWVRAQLAAAGGFDTSRTGEVVAEIAVGT